jgi:hypothetical protein
MCSGMRNLLGLCLTKVLCSPHVLAWETLVLVLLSAALTSVGIFFQGLGQYRAWKQSWTGQHHGISCVQRLCVGVAAGFLYTQRQY